MNVTKYEHSCMVVSKEGAKLVIDPGGFLATLPDLSGVAAVVVTHEHADHFSADRVRDIVAKNPDVRLIGPQGVADVAAPDAFEFEVVAPGDALEVGPFSLSFHGGVHNEIHSSIPRIDNVGVFVDELFYYGGDAYEGPGAPVALLAAPVGAPWLKIGEAMDYVLAVQPSRAFPVHDMTLSVAGKDLGNARLKWAVEQNGGTFQVLAPGESIDL